MTLPARRIPDYERGRPVEPCEFCDHPSVLAAIGTHMITPLCEFHAVVLQHQGATEFVQLERRSA